MSYDISEAKVKRNGLLWSYHHYIFRVKFPNHFPWCCLLAWCLWCTRSSASRRRGGRARARGWSRRRGSCPGGRRRAGGGPPGCSGWSSRRAAGWCRCRTAPAGCTPWSSSAGSLNNPGGQVNMNILVHSFSFKTHHCCPTDQDQMWCKWCKRGTNCKKKQ